MSAFVPPSFLKRPFRYTIVGGAAGIFLKTVAQQSADVKAEWMCPAVARAAMRQAEKAVREFTGRLPFDALKCFVMGVDINNLGAGELDPDGRFTAERAGRAEARAAVAADLAPAGDGAAQQAAPAAAEAAELDPTQQLLQKIGSNSEATKALASGITGLAEITRASFDFQKRQTCGPDTQLTLRKAAAHCFELELLGQKLGVGYDSAKLWGTCLGWNRLHRGRALSEGSGCRAFLDDDLLTWVGNLQETYEKNGPFFVDSIRNRLRSFNVSLVIEDLTRPGCENPARFADQGDCFAPLAERIPLSAEERRARLLKELRDEGKVDDRLADDLCILMFIDDTAAKSSSGRQSLAKFAPGKDRPPTISEWRQETFRRVRRSLADLSPELSECGAPEGRDLHRKAGGESVEAPIAKTAVTRLSRIEAFGQCEQAQVAGARAEDFVGWHAAADGAEGRARKPQYSPSLCAVCHMFGHSEHDCVGAVRATEIWRANNNPRNSPVVSAWATRNMSWLRPAPPVQQRAQSFQQPRGSARAFQRAPPPLPHEPLSIAWREGPSVTAPPRHVPGGLAGTAIKRPAPAGRR
eukprot:gene24994-50947_t